ncbi:hypothetical protein GCM10009839_72290 [Catenulispora yoronensis]|uniref:Uncharacterized protein n=1 Tax=Catenulispora yoronensis TaxID=450799 RepID=A0ABN2V7I9_9ACTN
MLNQEAVVRRHDAAPRRVGVVALVAVVVGLALMVAQLRALNSTWESCQVGGGPIDDVFPGGAAYTWLGADLLRFVLYAGTYVMSAVLGRRWISRPGPIGTALRVLVIVLLCAVPFGLDYAWGVRMDAGTFDPGQCAGGVPSWWPF